VKRPCADPWEVIAEGGRLGESMWHCLQLSTRLVDRPCGYGHNRTSHLDAAAPFAHDRQAGVGVSAQGVRIARPASPSTWALAATIGSREAQRQAERQTGRRRASGRVLCAAVGHRSASSGQSYILARSSAFFC
jgi:hypothetical protein